MMFSQYMITTLACFFGSTVEQNKQDERNENNVQYKTHKVVSTGSTGIRKRHCPLENILMLLTPEFRKLDFHHLIKMTEDAILRFKTEKDWDYSSEILSKIDFLETIQKLIENYIKDQNPLQQAHEDFNEYLQILHPEHRRIYLSLKNAFYKEITDEEQVEAFIKNKKQQKSGRCFSQCMTIAEAIQFWSQPDSIRDFDTSTAELKCAILKLLLGIRNSSAAERQFVGLKRNSAPQRPQLDCDMLFHEHFLRSLRSQSEVLTVLSDRNIEKMK